MSRQSEARKAAKKARRRKRQSARDTAWIPQPIFDELSADDDAADAIADAVADIDEWIAARGWVLDGDNGDNGGNVVSWVYPPSAADFDDEDREPVTRVWITVAEDDDAVVLEFGAILVGTGPDDDTYVLDPDDLAEDVAALEFYRPGMPRPELA